MAQTKIVVKTATDYRAPKPISNATPHPSTPLSSGAPGRAPAQTEVVTGKGPQTEGVADDAAGPALAPRPRANASNGPIEQGASVDYDKNQSSRIPGGKGGPASSSSDLYMEQAQELQDKAGA